MVKTKRAVDYKVKQTVLANGFVILTLRLPWVKSVSAGLFVRAGSRYENQNNNGMSHFLEHMIFKGSRRFPQQLEIAKTVESLGGEVDAYTSVDHTMFWNKLPSRHWRKGLEVLLDAVFYPLFPARSLAKERMVILQELARRDDSPTEIAWELFNQTAWPNQAIGQAILGRPEIINRLKRSDFNRYRSDLYCANNMVLVVAGDINHLEIKKYAVKFLADKPAKKVPATTTVTNQRKPQISILNKKTEQKHLVIGCQGYSIFDDERYPLVILETILGRGMGSRLFETIREKMGLAYAVFSFLSLLEDAGCLGVYAGVGSDNLTVAIKIILRELNRVKKELVGRKELETAKEKICGPLAFALETTEGWIKFLGPKMLLEKKIETVPEVIKKVSKVTAGQIRDVANSLLVDERLNLAVVGEGIKQGELAEITHF